MSYYLTVATDLAARGNLRKPVSRQLGLLP